MRTVYSMNNINLKEIDWYFLTTGQNERRKAHILDEFKEFKLHEINPLMGGISRNRSGSTGFYRMINAGLKDQDPSSSTPFQPFVMLEDDASKFRSIPDSVSVPENADLLYIGISNCGIVEKNVSWTHNVYADNIDDDLVLVKNLLTTHGIMVCSLKGAEMVQKCMVESYHYDIPWDGPLARAHSHFNVYALKQPFVYQEGIYGGNEAATKIVVNSKWYKNPIPKEFVFELDTSVTTNPNELA